VLTNQGAIVDSSPGDCFYIDAFYTNNTGTMSVVNGGSLSVDGHFSNSGSMDVEQGALYYSRAEFLSANPDDSRPDLFTNTAEITIAAQGTADILGDLDNSGTIAVAAGGTLWVQGANLHFAHLASHPVSTGSIALDGTLQLSGTVTAAELGTIVGGPGEIDINRLATLTDNDNSLGTNVFAAATGLLNAGLLSSGSERITFLGSVVNDGTLSDNGDLAFAARLRGAGVVAIADGATADLRGGSSAGETVAFAGGAGSLDLAAPHLFQGEITGFGGNDMIDLIDRIATSATFDAGTLMLDHGANEVALLRFGSSYDQANFVLASDGDHGTLITFKA
jgi:hypothetical protein